MPSPRALPLLEQKLILASRGFASLGAKAVDGLRGEGRGQKISILYFFLLLFFFLTWDLVS